MTVSEFDIPTKVLRLTKLTLTNVRDQIKTEGLDRIPVFAPLVMMISLSSLLLKGLERLVGPIPLTAACLLENKIHETNQITEKMMLPYLERNTPSEHSWAPSKSFNGTLFLKLPHEK